MTVRGFGAAANRLIGFGVVPALSLVSSIVLLPLIAHRFGPGGWTSVSVGTAVGAYAGVVIGLSWPVTGPHRVSQARVGERKHIFIDSMRSRGLAAATVIVPVIIVAGALAMRTDYMLSTILVAIGISINGFTAAWYFAGTGNPWLLVRNEALVRCAAYVMMIVCLALGAPFWTYGALLICSGVAMASLNWWTIIGRERLNPAEAPLNGERMRDQISGAGARFANSAFGTLTPVLFAAAQVPGLALFSALDQVQKTANNGLGAFPQALISFVSRQSGRSLRKRLRIVVLSGLACVVVGVVGFALVGQAVLNVLYRGKAVAGQELVLMVGFAIAMCFFGQLLQQVVLVPVGMVRASYLTMSVLSLVGIPTLIVASIVGGVLGAVATVAGVMSAIASIYLILAIVGIRRLAE